MSDCRQIESLLPPYVDGEAAPDAARLVEAHLQVCPLCRETVAAGRTVRAVIRARAAALVADAPPGLRTRILAAVRGERRPRIGAWGRAVRLTAAVAIMLLATLGFEFVSPQSNVLLAAQLALDHFRCFIVERHTVDEAPPDELRGRFAADYGWDVEVPASDSETGVRLVAARRCPFWLGDHAHLLYRSGDRQLSLYVTPGAVRPAETVRLLGHVGYVWAAHGDSYLLLSRDVPEPDLARIAEYLQRETTVAP